MPKFKTYKKSAFVICVLPFFAWTVAYFTRNDRIPNSREIYLTGVVIVYLLWATALTWGIVNSILIFRTEDQKISNKLIWTTLSILPLLLLFVGILFSIISN